MHIDVTWILTPNIFIECKLIIILSGFLPIKHNLRSAIFMVYLTQGVLVINVYNYIKKLFMTTSTYVCGSQVCGSQGCVRVNYFQDIRFGPIWSITRKTGRKGNQLCILSFIDSNQITINAYVSSSSYELLESQAHKYVYNLIIEQIFIRNIYTEYIIGRYLIFVKYSSKWIVDKKATFFWHSKMYLSI